MTLPCLRQVAQGVELSVLVQPRASRNQVVGLQGDELKVRLTAPPVDGAANKECIAFLAKQCRLPRSRVLLISGDASRHKRLLLDGLTLAEAESVFSSRLGT